MEEFQSNNKSSLLEFGIAEKLCQREHEQIHLFIAECSQLWMKSVQPALDIVNTQPILDEVNFRANESRGQTCLDYAECSRKWTKSKIVIFSGFSG